MINVIADTGGRSNVLWTHANCLSVALEYKQDICFWAFEQYKNEYMCKTDLVQVKFRIPNMGIRMKILALKILGKFQINQNTNRLFDKISKKRRIYVYNWAFGTDKGYCTKYRNEIQTFFTPKEEYIQEVKKKIKNIYSNYQCLIGVHIRRGDYKYWNEGKYYFGFDVYKKWMDQTYSLLKERGSCAFIAFSDEPIPEEFCMESYPIYIAGGTALEDQYLMSQCNYIISVPSTFAAWAEYMGNAKRAQMALDSEMISESKFEYRYRMSP